MNREVVVRLQGGLGNQMFQVAAALAWIGEKPKRLQVHLANYHSEDNRPFLLDIFTGPVEPLRRRTAGWILANARKIKNGCSEPPQLQWWSAISGWKVIREGTSFSWGRDNKVYLDGFWQDARLVNQTRGLCREWFTFKPRATYPMEFDEVCRENSVAVHVRRGDFVEQPGFEALGATYYREAVDYISEKVPQAHFFVFSDQPDLARQLINWPTGTIIAPAKKGRDAADDFFLMAHAAHHIISNSTFSWWAAWLAAGETLVFPEGVTGALYHESAFTHQNRLGISVR